MTDLMSEEASKEGSWNPSFPTGYSVLCPGYFLHLNL
jgi:hypothetical protein